MSRSEAAWGRLWFWLAWLGPAVLAVLVAWRLVSPVAAAVVALPALLILGRAGEVVSRIVTLVREHGVFTAAPAVQVDLEPQEVQSIHWWSLRKAGFDCHKPAHAYPGEDLTGKPWRVLSYQTAVRVPVARKHRGKESWGKQHVVRIAAYCRLLESCELAKSPFGVLLYAGTYEGVLIPNTTRNRFELESAIGEVRALLARVAQGDESALKEPSDKRCRGCPWGKPRRYVPGKSDTVLKGELVRPILREARGRWFHCTCGDRFGWVPPHDDAVALGIA